LNQETLDKIKTQFIYSNRNAMSILAIALCNKLLHRAIARLWKDHFKNDLRSDQDHRQKIDLRSRSRF
jgi:hypothetical protein